MFVTLAPSTTYWFSRPVPPEIDGLAVPSRARAADARREVQRLGERAANREVAQRVRVHHGANRRGPCINERGLSSDADRLRYATNLHRYRNIGDLSHADVDPWLLKRLEPLKLRADARSSLVSRMESCSGRRRL